MIELSALLDPMMMSRLCCLLMLTVLFLQSGLDKVFDRKGNLSWLREHFSSTPLRNVVPVLLSVITLAEVSAGILSLLGSIMICYDGSLTLGYLGGVLAALSVLMLFTGQRLAKDYEGASALVPYFLLTILTIIVCGM